VENHEISCDACRDLLPLYADGVTSAESAALVEAHVAACEDCQAGLTRLRTVLPILKKSPKRAMLTVKQKLRVRRVAIAVGSALGAAALLFGLIMFLVNATLPVKAPPKDLKCSVVDGVFKVSAQVDSRFTGMRFYPYKTQDGSDVFLVLLSMSESPLQRLWPALSRRISNPGGPYDFWHPERSQSMVFSLAGPSMFTFSPIPPSPPILSDHYFDSFDLEPLEPEEPWGSTDYNPEGKGLWLVYFIQERDFRLRRIEGDRTTGRLTKNSMQYATLVWEETIK